ncbi:hypothetical protein M758_7G021900 [Ceratodon purpureus]|nr:hypothetical protein M758_7G021900 [Ceratodon purpureus]
MRDYFSVWDWCARSSHEDELLAFVRPSHPSCWKLLVEEGGGWRIRVRVIDQNACWTCESPIPALHVSNSNEALWQLLKCLANLVRSRGHCELQEQV